MFTYQKLSVRSVLADALASMPLRLLLALPEYVTRDPIAPKHNVIGDIARFLQGAGWEGAKKIIEPHIWAPGWDAKKLEEFASTEFLGRADAPPQGLLENLAVCEWLDGGKYEIVHFTGYVLSFTSNPHLYLEGRRSLEAGELRDSLVKAGTRLLILNVPRDQFDYATRLAEMIVGGGGPATLVVAQGFQPPMPTLDAIPELMIEEAVGNWGQDVSKLGSYFSNFYLDLIHNYPMPRLGEPASWLSGDVRVSLFYGTDGEGMLDFTRWMDELEKRMRRLKAIAANQRSRAYEVKVRSENLLHRSQRGAIEELVHSHSQAASSLVNDVDQSFAKIKNVRDYIHEHEISGAIPLSAVAEAIPQLEDAARSLESQPLERRLDDEGRRAPRILNANFRDPEDPTKFLHADEGLPAGSSCELCVDVGPAWDKTETIVKGAAAFPIDSLPQEGDGWDIEVVLVSDDFQPQMVTGRFWLPRAGGRSYPYDDNFERATTSGPLVMKLKAPAFAKGSFAANFWARARLSLYYENNLLQSAVVKVGIVRSSTVVLSEKNVVEVDFVLTGNFHDAERFARRAVKFGKDDPTAKPIALNLTMNDDGNGNHRIIVKPLNGGSAPASPATSTSTPPPAGWTSYDPAAARQTLDSARTELRNCFFVRDQRGNPNPETSSLNNQNGKTREQFKLDLKKFALLGNVLFEMVTQDLQAADKTMTAREWQKQITAVLEESAVIQVARTGPANYAFPWSLVYEHPMPGPTFDYCPVIDEEWDAQGVRQAPVQKSCKHKNKPFHAENIYCPYGFWGLKHIIEQPASALRKVDGEFELGEVEKNIKVGNPINMAIGITRALNDLPLLDAHLREIGGFPGLAVVRPEATDVFMLRSALESPSIVYFACHGEYDKVEKLPYLGIGPSLTEAQYRIYPTTVRGWERTTKTPNLEAWAKNRPLVFINGCHTTDLTPGDVLNFVSSFTHAGASGVIGTEISVQPRVAFEVAGGLLKRILQKRPVGEALHEVRWDLANKGNLLGLAYTMYCLADLQLV